MSSIVEAAFNGRTADETMKKMGRYFAYDNSGASIREIALRTGENESSVWNALARLKGDMKVMEARMDHTSPMPVEGKTRIENKFRVKDEYIHELKELLFRLEGQS